MATDIDVRVISKFASLPEATIDTLLDAPTTELVKSLLQGIEKNAKECDQNKSQKVRLEVELETVVRTNESKVKVLQNSRDKALSDVQTLRGDLQAAETNRSRAEADLEQLRSSISSDTSELSSLKSRIASLEAANRDTLALLDSKTAAYDNLAQDLSVQHQKSAEQRKLISNLEQTIQSGNSAAAAFKFREQSLDQETNLLKRNNEWLENERKIKADEHSTFRKEKNARIAELSRDNEQRISEIESLRRSETSLKRRLDERNRHYEDLSQELQKEREDKIATEANLRSDIDDANRLAELQRQSADTARERVRVLEQQLQEAEDDMNTELAQIRADAEADHSERLAAEQKITELESAISHLQSELDQARQAPATPQQHVNGFGTSTPLRPSTPQGIFSPSSASKTKSNVSVTQMFTEYKRLEKELANERRTNEELQTNIDSMLQELESSKPEVDEIHADHTRVQNELIEMSALVEQTTKERDQSAKDARSYRGQLESADREIEVLRQQLRDLGSEIRYLLMEQHVRENGSSMSPEDFKRLQEAADEGMRQDTASLSETQQVINQQLIVFKNVSDLQQQNENQLKTIRNLVANLESRESQEREERFASMEREIQALKGTNASLNDELKTMMANSKSFVKERDMFRNMLTRKGHLPPNVDPADFSRSLPISRGSPAPGLDESATGGSDYSRLLRELQQHLDTVRQEASTNHASLRSQVDELSKRNSQLQTEASRALGQLGSANQRCEMIQANYDMLRTENSEIQKRSYADMERANQLELKVQQAAEELVETRGLLDSMRRESANLKAEKDLWKSVEKRLIDDNESLRNERARLDSLTSSLQTMINERDQTDSETRRRLQSQVESLETELASAKRKLDAELEESKKAAMRKDYDHEQSQKRIDDLMSSLSTAREELASAKTSKEHLQARVDELTVELRSAEERLEVYTKPPEPENQETTSQETGISKEQEMALEISQLKRDLELAKAELKNANEQIETYKNISQSAEDRLQELSETNDQYREETEASIAEKDSKIKDLEQRIQDISSELESTSTELSKSRDDRSDFDRRVGEAKASLEADVSRLRESEERANEQAQFNLEASKAQAAIATEAQENYEKELVKHAEATQALHMARSDANNLRLQVVELKTKAETAESNLEEKEASWGEMKDRYEQELGDLKMRRDEIRKQNDHLHEQLQNLTKQVTSLQSDRHALSEGTAAEDMAPELADLQEVINYLRREKEIVDIQYKQSNGEATRLRQQLELAQSQLDETRLKLDQQRRAEADSERNTMSHNKLMETLNELNLYRESSVTLRAENKQASQALAEKTRQVEEVHAQIQPLRAKVAELENLLEDHDGELKILQNDRDHWRQRTNDILSKYNRIDPEELEGLKTQLADLEKERDEAVLARNDLQAQADSIPQQISTAKAEQKNALQEQFKGRVRDMNAKIKEKQGEVDTAVAEKNTLQSELDVVREQLESAHNQTIATTDKSPGQVTEGTDERIAELEARVSELEGSLTMKDEEVTLLRSEQQGDTGAVAETVLNERLDQLRTELEQTKDAALEELRSSLERKHQEEVESLRASATAAPAERTLPNSDNAAPISLENLSEEQLLQLPNDKARFLVRSHGFINNLIKANVRDRINKEVEQQREAIRAELEARVAQTPSLAGEQTSESEKSLKAAREQIIQEKEAEFAAAKEAMEKDFKVQFEKEKEALVTQHQEELKAQKLAFSEQEARKIEEQVKRAEQMAAQKGKVQLNMAQNRERGAQAKIAVVEKASTDTPERAVKEVWEEAKVAKPAPAPKPSSNAPATASPQPSPAKPANARPTPAVAQVEQPNALQSSPPLTPANDAPQQLSNQQNVPNGAVNKPTTNAGANTLRSASALPQPRGASSIRGRGAPAAQGGGRGAATSGIPRGTGIPRGAAATGRGARSASMGGPQHPPAGRGAGTNSVASSPRGGMNPAAQQFVPGAKRPREEGDGQSRDDGQGKRVRGGGLAGS